MTDFEDPVFGTRKIRDKILNLGFRLNEDQQIADPVCPVCGKKLFFMTRRLSLFKKNTEIRCPSCLGKWPAQRFCIFCGIAGKVFNHFNVSFRKNGATYISTVNLHFCEKCQDKLKSLFPPNALDIQIKIPDIK
jgi:DNA-directed RNA polymerase subunit RPC12/RpoP